jgi:hypothetical protein
MRLTTVGYVVTPHVHRRLITLTPLVPRRFRQYQIPDDGHEELSNVTYYFAPEVWEKHVDKRLLGSHDILRGGGAFEVTRRPYCRS